MQMQQQATLLQQGVDTVSTAATADKTIAESKQGGSSGAGK
jgi:hypothetical protein